MPRGHAAYPGNARTRGTIACRKRLLAEITIQEQGSRPHYKTEEEWVNHELEMCVASCQPEPIRKINVTDTKLGVNVDELLPQNRNLAQRCKLSINHRKSLPVLQKYALYKLPVKPALTTPSYRAGGRGPIVSLSGRRGLSTALSAPAGCSGLSQSKSKTNKADENSSKWHKVLQRLHRNTDKENWKHYDVFNLFKFDELWYAAYGKLAKNDGSTTSGVSDITIDGTT